MSMGISHTAFWGRNADYSLGDLVNTTSSVLSRFMHSARRKVPGLDQKHTQRMSERRSLSCERIGRKILETVVPIR